MHIPVLLHEAIEGLALTTGDTVVDGTFGGGGHSRAILATAPSVRLICVDLDEAAGERFAADGALSGAQFVHANYQDVADILDRAGVVSVSKVLLDLGTSSFQLDEDTRGFSFKSDTPLLMTLSKHGAHTGFTAYDIVNSWEESSIADILFYYGEERRARTIARTIVSARQAAPIKTSGALASLIASVVPRFGKIHPATKTFQALRIAVNDELQTLTRALDRWWKVLSPGGRIVVITFHSLEDRIVKVWMKEQAQHSSGRVITKKPIAPTKEEARENPRSRSAKLRVIEKAV